jgi:nucleoside-diphosphate-sugar epimerase
VILVTGANGFVGRSVCAQLARAGVPRLGVDRHVPQTFDVADAAAVQAIFRKHSICAVIHLAAMLPSACRAHPAEAARVNVGGSIHVLEAAARAGVPRFVFGSSMSVYGAARDYTPVSEQAPVNPVDLYGAAKRYIEIYGQSLARGTTFVALRIATVVGPGARETASLWRSEIFEKLRTGAPYQIQIPVSEDAVLSLAHVGDVARMLVALATTPHLPSPIYNSPAENWRAADLKLRIETLDPAVTVALTGEREQPKRPVADGAAFIRDFAWTSPSAGLNGSTEPGPGECGNGL